MILMKKWLLAVFTVCSLALVGCTVPTLEAERPIVVVGLYPYVYVVENIGGDRVSVTNLVGGNVEPHDLELTSRQLYTLDNADLVIYQRGFQPAVDAAVDTVNTARLFDATTVVPLETSEEGVLDQHIWLDPIIMMTVAEDVASLLIELDPAGERSYNLNLEKLLGTLTELDADYTQGLATCERQVFLVEHAAFGYLAQRYNLTQISVKGVNPDAEPSPAHIARISEQVKDLQLTRIFHETRQPSGLIQTLATDLNVGTSQLDPLEQTPMDLHRIPHDLPTYVSIMEDNLEALRQANGCQ